MKETFAIEAERLYRALAAANLGDWRWDVATDLVQLSERGAAIFGLPAGAPITWTAMRELLHAEDRERARLAVEQAIAEHSDYDIEYRVENPPGACRWVAATGRAIYDADGVVTGMVGVVQDITRRATAEAALRRSEERFYKAFHASPVPMSLTAVASGRFLDVNEALLETNGFRRDEFVGRTSAELNVWAFPEERERMLGVVAQAGRARNLEVHFRMKSGEVRMFLISVEKIELDGEACILMTSFDITDRKRAEEALQEADRRKDEFLAMLAHELRNPLAPIRNAARALRHLGPPDPQLVRLRDMIERQVEHLTRLVDDLLDVSRITQGRILLRQESVELTSLLNRAIETARPLIDARHQQLHVALPADAVRLEGDATRLAQIFANLLHNASKYSDDGGNIWLRAEVLEEAAGEVRREGSQEVTKAATGAAVVVRVRDEGIGISPDVLPHIFALFTQADRSLDRAQGGLGVGLTIVSSLVEMHGGRVEAFSDGVGKGSEFVVRLPVALATRTSVGAQAVAAPAPASGCCRVLVVDDNVDAADSLSLLLKLEGHEVRTAHDGLGALKTSEAFCPQVVLLDIGLPGMNGYEVATRLRDVARHPQPVLIALTGYGQAEDRRRSQAAGFDHHLTKPVDYDVLMPLIKSLVVGC